MSELFSKEVNAQKEFEKILRGSRMLPQAHEKVCNENERKKKTTGAQKKEGVYKARTENWCHGYQTISGQ